MAVSVANIQQYTVGGAIYTGVTKPADKTPMTHTAGVPTGGTDIGATTGPATFEYRPTISTTDIEQVFGLVAPRLTTETATLKFTAIEATYTNLANAAQQGTVATPAGKNTVKLGGKTAVTPQTVAIMSKHASDAFYVWLCCYSVVSMDGLSVAFKRGEPRQIAMTLTCIPDTTRPAGDQLAQYMDETFE